MKIIWTESALKSLKNIFNYYSANASVEVASRIKDSIIYATRQLSTHSRSGSIEFSLKDFDNQIRYIVKGNYKILYTLQKAAVYILLIFDTRQDPSKLYKNLAKDDFSVNEP